jgi:hypothetical protein
MSDRTLYEETETKPASTNLLTDEKPAIQARMPESRQNKNKNRNKERTNHMTNMLNQLTGLARLTKTKFLVILAITGVGIAATFLHADSGGTQPEHNTLAGTWKSEEFGGSNLASFMSDGRMTYTIPLTILTGNGPGGSSELAAPAPGEWARTGNREFVFTAYSVLSSPTVAFTHLVKLTSTLRLNDTSDEFTQSGTVSVYFQDGTLQGSFPGEETHFRRVIAGQ